MSEDTLLDILADDEIRDKQSAREIAREGFFANSEVQEAMKEIGIDPADFRKHLERAEKKHLLDEAIRKDWSRTLRREISPGEWAQHKKEVEERRRATILTRIISNLADVEEESEYLIDMETHDRIVSEEQRLQKIVEESAGPQHPFRDASHPDHEIEVARVQSAIAKQKRIDEAIEGAATVRELLDILEEE